MAIVPFVTGQTLGAVRNNFDGTVGFRFTTGANPITVTALGRWIVSGNTGTHELRIGSDVNGATLATASLDTNGKTAGQFAYVDLASSLTLAANTTYYFGSVEVNGGDQWNDDGPITTTAVATVDASAYRTITTWADYTAGSRSFVPVSFLYDDGAGTPSRFYLPSSGAAAVSPAFGGWQQLSADRIALSRTRGAGQSAFATRAAAEALAAVSDVCVRQYVSEPLAAQTISGTVKGILRAMESHTAADMRSQLLIRVVSNDGATFRGTLLDFNASALASEWVTALTNRKFPLGWASPGATLTSVAAQEGDRLVIEVGYRAHNTVTTSRTGTIEFGNVGTSDLAEDETSTAQLNPWIEFSQDIKASTTTVVGKDVQALWDLQAPVAKTVDGRWDTFASVGAARQALWDVFVPVAKTAEARWDVVAHVGASRQALWEVQAPVAKETTVRWDVLSAVAVTRQALWDVAVPAGKNVQSLWDVAASVGVSRQALWDVRGVVGASVTGQWDVFTAVAQAISAAWDVRSAVGTTTEARWDLAAAVAADLAARWDVEGPVARHLTAQWDVAAAVARALNVQWDVAASVGRSVDGRWDVLAGVGKDVQALWDVAGTATAVGRDLQALWDLRAPVGRAVEGRWDVFVPVAQALRADWDVRTSVGVARQALWDLSAPVDSDIAGLWDVRATTSDDLSARWDVLVPTARDLAVQWDVATLAGREVAARWDVLGRVGRDLVVLWDIEGLLFPIPVVAVVTLGRPGATVTMTEGASVSVSPGRATVTM